MVSFVNWYASCINSQTHFISVRVGKEWWAKNDLFLSMKTENVVILMTCLRGTPWLLHSITVTAFSLFLASITSIIASWRWLCTCAGCALVLHCVGAFFSLRQTLSQPKSAYSQLTMTFEHCWRWASMVFWFGLALQPLLGQPTSRSEHSSQEPELM